MRRIIFGLVMLWAALFGACQASAFYNSRDSNYNIAIASGGSSYTYKTGQTANIAGSSFNYPSQNLGSGSQFVFVGVLDGSVTLNGVSVNGTPLAPVVSFTGNAIYSYAGMVTLTGSDVISVTSSGNFGNAEVDVLPYVITGLVSTTPVATNSNASSNITASCAVGDFVFAMVAVGANFSASAQTPTGTHTIGADPALITDWIANSTGCSGGTFTATNGGFNGEWIAVYH